MRKFIVAGFLILAGLGCGKADDAMDAAIESGKKIDEATRLAKFKAGLDLLTSTELTKDLNLPLAMLAGADLVAKNGREDEIVPLAYSWYQALIEAQTDEDHQRKVPVPAVRTCVTDLSTNKQTCTEEVPPRPSVKKCVTDQTTNTQTCTEEVIKKTKNEYTQDYVEEFNLRKKKYLQWVRTVAAMLPHRMVNEIVLKEIQKGGEFETFAYSLLAARARFINDILIRDDLLEKRKLRNLDTIEKAYNYCSDLKYLMDLPFADRLEMPVTGFIKADGNIDKDRNFVESLPSKEIMQTVELVKERAEKELESKWQNDSRAQVVKIKIKSL